MNLCTYDGTLQGLFTAAFELYKSRIVVYGITCSKEIQYIIGSATVNIETDAAKAGRIKNCILRHTGAQGYDYIKYAFASGKENKDLIIYNYLIAIFEHGKDAPYMLGDSRVSAFFDTARAVMLECHRMKGFIRFKECENYSYADYTPDNNITQFIIGHFAERYCSMNFIIHDTKRNIIGIFNGKKYRVFKNKGSLTVYLTESERAFSDLWKMYYNTISVSGRKNLKLMKRCMPVRYWKNLSEKDELK